MELRWGGAARRQRSYLSELLDIAHGTGWRITAVCPLRYQDLRLEETARAPYGAILWLAELPKQRGSLLHASRRAWATARKHLPVTDVAAAGGWRSTDPIQRCYQQPDEGTIWR